MTTATELLIVVHGEHEIPVEQLKNNPNNPRREVGDVTDLAASIKEVGLIEALNVNPNPFNPAEYWIAAGERRWVAMKHWTRTIRCHVEPLPAGVPPAKHQLVVGLVENGHREGLNPIDRANAYGRLHKEFRMTMEQIGTAVGLSSSSISNSMILLELAPKAQQAVAEGKLSVKDATTIVRAHRAKERVKKGGSKTAGAQWDSALFTWQWPLARRAQTMCRSQQAEDPSHGDRRTVRGIACEHCIDRVIRLDEAKIRRIDAENDGLKVTTQSAGYDGTIPNGHARFSG